MADPIGTPGAGTRGPQVYNETADRTMKYFSVAEIELKSITQSSTLTTVGLSVTTWALGFAIESYRDYKSGNVEAWPWVLAAFFVAVPFLIIGIVGIVQGNNIMRDIKQGRPPTA
jgi:hypothetical protein